MEKVQKFNAKVRASAKSPDLNAGDIVKVHRKIKEGGKERVQVFEGIVVSVKGKQSSSPMATIRRVSFGIGVELTIPVLSPRIAKIEICETSQGTSVEAILSSRQGHSHLKTENKRAGKFCGGRAAKLHRCRSEKLVEQKGSVEQDQARRRSKEKEIDFWARRYYACRRGAGIGRRASLRGWCPLGRGEFESSHPHRHKCGTRTDD